MKKEWIKRGLILLAALALITFCLLFADTKGIPSASILGAYISAAVVFLLLFKFPLQFYIQFQIFQLLAMLLGSLLQFYTRYPFYDKVVHFLSGIILANIGFYLFCQLLKRAKNAPLEGITILFSGIFSTACAALWEIYEFTADHLLHTDMQGSNLDTMGDIIAGTLGGLLYIVVYLLITKLLLKRKHGSAEKHSG